MLRDIKPVGVDQDLQEIELTFGDTKTGEENKLLVSGINLKDLPKLPVGKYPDGLYMPIGIGVPPFSQSYEQLESNHPDQSPYFSVFLDSEGRWIDHNRLAVAGVAMHLDAKKPDLVHLYLLSYERSTLIAHFQINL
ncbi:MAG: hypothetical protein HC764_24780 [Pleurocapsa sp. CRU_1_2]|nr:hypothetical protein [Pleurocapsa sp. CRU_1_2]